MGLRNFVIRRLILIVPTFFLISIIIFVLIHAAPGDPTDRMFGVHGADPEVIQAAIVELGLDQPVLNQYVLWLSKLLQFDLGFSYVDNTPIWRLISNRIPRTLELMLVAEVVSVVIAVVLGVIAAVKELSAVDSLASLAALIGYATPNFWIAFMLMFVFSVQLGWLPTSSMITEGLAFPSPFHWLFDHLKHLVLPTTVLVMGWTAYLFRMVRSSMLEVLRQDYITTARAKGLKERVVIYKHALRNALLPIVTYESYSVGFLFGGAAVVETIYAWPGLGQFMVDRALKSDYPALMGISMIIALMVLIANVCADITYVIVDPRIRYD